MIHELARVLGLTDPGGSWYLAWSGILGDVADAAIIGGIVSVYRSKTCDVRRCYRLARYPVKGHVDWTICRVHARGRRPTVADLRATVGEDALPADAPED